jgi:hypothetical protein
VWCPALAGLHEVRLKADATHRESADVAEAAEATRVIQISVTRQKDPVQQQRSKSRDSSLVAMENHNWTQPANL